MREIIPPFTAYNWTILMLMALGTTTFGYGMVFISGALGQANFCEYMNLVKNPAKPGYDHISNYIRAATACLLPGAMIGACINGWTADSFGRRIATQIGAVTIIVGGALQAGSINQGMFFVGRLVDGRCMGALWTALPMYEAEISTPDSRGFIVSMAGLMFSISSFLSV